MSENVQFLVPTDEYLKTGIHIGTKYKTKQMNNFIFKTRPDGLSILNLQKIDERLKIASKFLANYEPKDILVVCRRENGWKAANMFGEIIGCDVFTKKYPAGILTNTSLDNFKEKKVILIADPWPDRNAIADALKVGIPIVALCDTNNTINGIDLVIPANNKGRKSLGLIFMLLAREYLKNKGKIKSDEEFNYKLEDFIEY